MSIKLLDTIYKLTDNADKVDGKHASDFATSGHTHSYLPLSGGTLSGSGSGLLTINRTSGNPLIQFTANGTLVGFLGINTSGAPIFVNKDTTSYNLLHSNNSSVSKSGETLTVKINGTTQSLTNTNTTYSAGTGLSLSGTIFSNSGVRSISTGSANGTISVNTNGSSANVAVKGLGSAAYTASTAYAAASHNHSNHMSLPAYNYTSGCLVKTDIPTASNTMITFRIEGNSYGNKTILTTGHFYNYNDNNQILSADATNHGYGFGDISVFCYSSYVYLWFKQASNYQSFIIYVYSSNTGTAGINRAISVSNNAIPSSGVTRKVVITPRTSLDSSNWSSYCAAKSHTHSYAASSHTHNYASTVKVGSTSYTCSSNVISLPAYPTVPTSLKCPTSLTIQANGTSLGSYDGSAAKTFNITYSNVGAAASSHTHNSVTDYSNGTAITFQYSTGGFTSNPSWLGAWNGYQLTYVSPSVLSVNYANSAGSAGSSSNAGYCYVFHNINNKTAYPTVGSAKNKLAELWGTDGDTGIGRNIIVSESVISQWGNDSASTYDSSVYSMIKIGGGYNRNTYGQYLLSTYASNRIGYIGRNGGNWTTMYWLATTSDLTWNSISGKPSSFTPASHNHSAILDIGNSTSTTFAYSKAGLNYSDYTWLAGWNGYELRAINKSQFAQASHTHSYAASSHTHSYAGSSSAGGAATSANKLNTNAGSATKPVYFTNGVPTACTYGFNGAYGMPVVLAAGYIYKNSYTSTTWAFSGSYCPALTGGITTSVSGGVLAVTWTAASGRSRYIYGAVANMRTSGAVTSYSGTEYKDRSLGMYWLGTATSTTTTYIRAMSQGDQNNDTGMSYVEMWGTSSQNDSHCILSFSIIVIGYWT